MSFSVRRLQPNDDVRAAAQLFDQYRQFYKQSSDQAAARMFLAMRLAAGQSVIFLAEEGGADEARRAVGFMQLYPLFSSIQLSPVWLLNDLYTLPAARGRGVGAALLDAAARFGREHGAGYLFLETAITNSAAQRLYESRGWQRDAEFFTYALPLDGGGKFFNSTLPLDGGNNKD